MTVAFDSGSGVLHNRRVRAEHLRAGDLLASGEVCRAPTVTWAGHPRCEVLIAGTEYSYGGDAYNASLPVGALVWVQRFGFQRVGVPLLSYPDHNDRKD